MVVMKRRFNKLVLFIVIVGVKNDKKIMDEKKRKKHKEIIKEMPHFLRSFDK